MAIHFDGYEVGCGNGMRLRQRVAMGAAREGVKACVEGSKDRKRCDVGNREECKSKYMILLNPLYTCIINLKIKYLSRYLYLL